MHLKRYLPLPLLAGTCLAWAISNAQAADTPYRIQSQGSVIGDDVLYSIGGGNAVSMGSVGNMDSIQIGGGWNNNLICGNLSLTNTLQNQLNGVTDGFKTIMGSMLQNSTAAVMSIPGLMIQRANPALYNFYTNGIGQGRLDFDRSKATCRAIADKMLDVAGGQVGWNKLAEGEAMKSAAANTTDAVAAIHQVEQKGGNDGVTWVGGTKAGGSGQQPIKVVSDVTKAGYNLLSGRAPTSTGSIPASSCNGGLVCSTWSSPQEAATFATRVLGEQQEQTCDNCQKTVTQAGAGLTPLIQETYDTKLKLLNDLLAQRKPLTDENLAAAGSNAIPVTRGLVEALRNDQDQDVLAKRLASEVSLAEIIEKALALLRVIFAGSQEPNVAANEVAQKQVGQDTAQLQTEIQNLKTELDLRREMAGNAPTTILQRAAIRKDASKGIFQGDPLPNRLDRVENPSKGK
ncbi:conjugal transfer protein [Pseudomonas oryzihabitans]|nr:conjugal transfer protein [Pseudomonas psychrotolerans]KTT40061.1 conjugal transfer protein [Pseudomonas psychrotolerans]KTT43860.1 conjugal transfer protein [Pseudomonas psychrotolerans]KTT64605.1 conjugal transfer protein [Pseudomonas psychrotolerans]